MKREPEYRDIKVPMHEATEMVGWVAREMDFIHNLKDVTEEDLRRMAIFSEIVEKMHEAFDEACLEWCGSVSNATDGVD